jgi:Flp pilus assembly protein TadD
MGLLKYRQEKYDEALDALSLSASIIPEEARTQYFLGKTLVQKGNRTGAEAALRKAVHLRPGWAEAHFSLAMVYATQQPPFKELAQWHYQKAIASGYPRNLDFEKLLEERKGTAANTP